MLPCSSQRRATRRRRCVAGALLLAGFTAAAASGAAGAGDAPPRDRAWFTAGAPRFLVDLARRPSYEVTVSAEDGEYETAVSFTILDRMPDWRRPLSAVRRLLRAP
jgi:hypothetical protein